jgi:hypothetical protein
MMVVEVAGDGPGARGSNQRRAEEDGGSLVAFGPDCCLAIGAGEIVAAICAPATDH